MQLTKTTFIRQLSQAHQRPQKHYAAALEDILAGIQQSLAQGHTIAFLGFGAFYTHKQPAAHIKQIGSGRTVTIPAHARVGFRVGEALRRAVRGRYKRGRFHFLHK